MTDKKRIEFLKKMLSTNVKWAVTAMFRINQNQTIDEVGTAIYRNGKGFNKFDSAIIECYIAKLHDKQTLTVNEFSEVLKIMPKYAEQLLKTKTDVEKLDRIIEKAEAVGM